MTRRWFNVGVVKIPHAQRDVAHTVLGERPGDRWQDIVGAATPDDDERFPVGAHCTYRAWLDDDEAARFRAASNCRYVVEDVTLTGVTCSPFTLPGWRTRSTIGYWDTTNTVLPGDTVNVAVLDTGSSSAARGYMGQILVSRSVFVATPPPDGENYPGVDHGSLCASDAVPAGGRLLEGIVIDGNDSSTDAIIAQGVTWAVSQGAKVVSGSFGLTTTLPATSDALTAAEPSDVVFYFAAGNRATATLDYPAAYSLDLSYVYAVGGWDMSTGYRWTGSSWHQQLSGMAPSILVRGVTAAGVEAEWYGTSSATPCVANLCARLVGAGFTARDAAAALAATTDRRGYADTQVGGGLFSLSAAASQLGVLPPITVPVPQRRVRAAGLVGAW